MRERSGCPDCCVTGVDQVVQGHIPVAVVGGMHLVVTCGLTQLQGFWESGGSITES